MCKSDIAHAQIETVEWALLFSQLNRSCRAQRTCWSHLEQTFKKCINLRFCAPWYLIKKNKNTKKGTSSSPLDGSTFNILLLICNLLKYTENCFPITTQLRCKKLLSTTRSFERCSFTLTNLQFSTVGQTFQKSDYNLGQECCMKLPRWSSGEHSSLYLAQEEIKPQISQINTSWSRLATDATLHCVPWSKLQQWAPPTRYT